MFGSTSNGRGKKKRKICREFQGRIKKIKGPAECLSQMQAESYIVEPMQKSSIIRSLQSSWECKTIACTHTHIYNSETNKSLSSKWQKSFGMNEWEV